MSIIVYKCDVCKRTIEKLRKPNGFEVIQRCTITHGCRGKLYQTKVLPDYIRGQLPNSVQGLTDWIPRKVLYNHQQALKQTEWIIKHNMGVNPTVTAFVDRPTQTNPDNREELTPTDIILINDNKIKLVFEREYSGIAQLISQQSDPDLLNSAINEVETPPESIQLSNQGELTIATLISTVGTSPSISLNVQYSTTTSIPFSVGYTADDQPSILSPWIDSDKIIVRGKLYTVRSYNGLIPEMTSGVVNSGSNFQFTGLDTTGTRLFRNINKDEVLLLLAKYPFERVDKQTNVFIDVTSVSSTDNTFGLFYDSGEFFSSPSIVQNVYPLIRSV